MSAAAWVVVGCGYTGERLARALLSDGQRVVVTSRSAARAARLAAALPGAEARVLDPADEAAVAQAVPPGAVVVDSVPTEGAGAGPGHVPALVRGAAAAGARRVVYLSATSVYGRRQGEWVDEDTPPSPDTARGLARLAAEEALGRLGAELGVETVALRIAAIYGPGRGVHERLRAGAYRVVGDGSGWTGRIHVDDLVAVIRAAGTVAPLPRTTYVVADTCPTTVRELADGVAALLGLPPPPAIPADQVPAEVAEMFLGNRRFRTTRLAVELGVVLRYPSWREGMAALL